MRKYLIIAVLLPVLAYAGAKGYLWYSIYSQMEDIKDKAAIFATVEYKEIRAPLTEPFGVTGITITPHAINDTIRVGSVLVHNSGLRQLYELIKKIRRGETPDNLEVSIYRISMDLNGEIMSYTANNQKTNLAGTPLDSLGCGNREYFTPADLLQMEYEKIFIDSKLNYKTNRSDRSVDFYLKFQVRDATSLAIDASIPGEYMPTSGGQLMVQVPQVKSVSVNIEDLSFNERRNKYCSKLTGTTLEGFVEKHLEAVKSYAHSHGFPVSDELINAYRSYVTGSGNITISINPLDPIDMMSLANLNARQILEWLGVEVNIAGKNVRELMVAAIEEEKPESEQEIKPKVAPDTYKPTPVAELNQHINRLLKVRTVDGKLHHAYLNNIAKDALVLTQELVGGSATFKVPISDIDEVRVLY